MHLWFFAMAKLSEPLLEARKAAGGSGLRRNVKVECPIAIAACNRGIAGSRTRADHLQNILPLTTFRHALMQMLLCRDCRRKLQYGP